ncbi:MAG: DUF1858 domain-containing protein [Eubacterium sp.]|nr:DUF1858 domain-containing protein [Eubacterium sp.]
MIQEVTADMLIGDVLKEDVTIAPIMMASGMHCIGCPASQGESIQQACEVHGVDVQDLIEKINEFLKNKNHK